MSEMQPIADTGTDVLGIGLPPITGRTSSDDYPYNPPTRELVVNGQRQPYDPALAQFRNGADAGQHGPRLLELWLQSQHGRDRRDLPVFAGSTPRCRSGCAGKPVPPIGSGYLR